jgi:hypothetical protein
VPARDTYVVKATIRGEYNDEPEPDHRWDHSDYLAPHQTAGAAATMANVLRSMALDLAPEHGDTRSEVSIYTALDTQRKWAMRLQPGGRALVIERLWALAESLNIEWYGAKQ